MSTTPPSRARGVDVAGLLDRRSRAHPVLVAVPVHNGGDVVRRCLESVLRWTRGARVVAIDDASTDPAVVALLDDLAEHTRLELVRHDVNQGYTRTANHALGLDPDSDVVLLNSDTEVGPQWLQRLLWVAASEPDVATVSAVSDNAGAMAVPDPGVANDWPSHLPWAEIALAAGRADLPWAVEAPTGHGFCMLMTREAIRRLGGFDETAFPRGYGEENDFCMRAREAGLRNLVAPHVLVRHARGQSFGPGREALMAEGRRAVDARHPTYTADIRAWMSGAEMAAVREGHGRLLAELRRLSEVRPARLYVLHAASGGTPATNLDLMTGLADRQDSYLVEATASGRLTLHRVTHRGLRTLATWQADSPFAVTDAFRRDYAEAIAGWIVELGVGTVHARHLINQPLTALSEVCSRLGVPLVLSTHDFYMVCPSVHLLDGDLRFCGGRCTPGPGPCRMPTPFVATAPDLKHRWIHEWRRRAAGVFAVAEAVVATTNNAESILVSSYPELAGRVTVIEHGRDIDAWAPSRSGARLPGPLRVLAVANWDPHKGTDYLRSMATELGDEVELHVFGQRSEDLAGSGVVHGRYARESFPDLCREVDPDLVALVSIWPETYSHTLTEAWALGIPVLATDIGAVAERVRAYGGGVLVPVGDPVAAAAEVRGFARDLGSLEPLRGEVPRSAVRTRAAMVEDYRDLYRGGPDEALRVGLVVRGSLGRHPGSVHVRSLRRVLGPGIESRVRVRQVFPEEVLRAGRCPVDVLLVQRDAVATAAEPFLRVLRREGVRLVVELDDDLLGDGAVGRLDVDPDVDARLRTTLDALVRAADGVVVSTDLLADAVRRRTTGPVTVVPNALDPRLWCSEAPASPSPSGETVRILYMGSRTHDADLALLEEVVPAVAAALGRPVELEVVGVVADASSAPGWFSPLPIPGGASAYPRFVAWLRENRARWTVGVAPLVDSPFNRAKSDLKLLEYAGLELPVVASDVGPYRDAVELADLVPNVTDAWVRAVTGLVESESTRAARVARSRTATIPARLLPASDDLWLDAVLGDRVRAR